MYTNHFDVWLINQEQSLIEQTHELAPDSIQLTGWVNGDLYTQSNETIGILPIPDSTRGSANMLAFNPITDNKSKQVFLAQEQGTKFAVISVHTKEE